MKKPSLITFISAITTLIIAFDLTAAEPSTVELKSDEHYLVAPLDLRQINGREQFSQVILESEEQPVYLSLISSFAAPCSGWIDGPVSDEEATSCEWLITLDKCDPIAEFGGDVSETVASECAPLLYIQSPVGDAYNRVRTCKGYGYHLTGFYSIQYLEAAYGREVYQAIRVPVDAEKAIQTHKQLAGQTCYSMSNH